MKVVICNLGLFFLFSNVHLRFYLTPLFFFRKHPCDMCDFRAVRGDHLTRHKRQKHSGAQVNEKVQHLHQNFMYVCTKSFLPIKIAVG